MRKFVVDHITGKGYIFPFSKGEKGDPGPEGNRGARGRRGRRGKQGEHGFAPSVNMTVLEFHNQTITQSCYITITDDLPITIHSHFLYHQIPAEKFITVRHAGALAISGANSPEAAYEPLDDGYREFSIYKNTDGETTITVYEKSLKHF